jgi:GTP-binding protein
VPADAKDIVDEYKILLNELKQFNPELLDKQRVLAISKADLLDAELEKEMTADIKKRLKGKSAIEFMFFSSHTEKNIMQLKDLLWRKMNEHEF